MRSLIIVLRWTSVRNLFNRLAIPTNDFGSLLVSAMYCWIARSNPPTLRTAPRRTGLSVSSSNPYSARSSQEES
jgi:hypothetical protein